MTRRRSSGTGHPESTEGRVRHGVQPSERYGENVQPCAAGAGRREAGYDRRAESLHPHKLNLPLRIRRIDKASTMCQSVRPRRCSRSPCACFVCFRRGLDNLFVELANALQSAVAKMALSGRNNAHRTLLAVSSRSALWPRRADLKRERGATLRHGAREEARPPTSGRVRFVHCCTAHA
jgi:hypothetical protein